MGTPSEREFDLVVLDLDGTILDLYHHKPITAAVIDAIAAVQAAGVPVTIATGRTLDYVRDHVARIGITTPVVTTQGAVIGHPITGEVLDETTIDLPLARAAAHWIDAQPYVIGLYFLAPDGRTVIYQNRTGPEPDFYDHVFGAPRIMQPRFADLLAADSAHPPLKFLVVEDARPAAGGFPDLVAELKARFSPDLYITRTHPRLVEGTAHNMDKGEGMLRLCRMLGVNPTRVLAIGDSDNDIPMLQAAGYAVAMGNSSEGVRAVAHWEAPSVEEDGAAVAMRRIVLGEDV